MSVRSWKNKAAEAVAGALVELFVLAICIPASWIMALCGRPKSVNPAKK